MALSAEHNGHSISISSADTSTQIRGTFIPSFHHQRSTFNYMGHSIYSSHRHVSYLGEKTPPMPPLSSAEFFRSRHASRSFVTLLTKPQPFATLSSTYRLIRFLRPFLFLFLLSFTDLLLQINRWIDPLAEHLMISVKDTSLARDHTAWIIRSLSTNQDGFNDPAAAAHAVRFHLVHLSSYRLTHHYTPAVCSFLHRESRQSLCV